MKHTKVIAAVLAAVLLAGCGAPATSNPVDTTEPMQPEGVQILLGDDGITVDGARAATDSAAAVYTAKDIVYYEAGKDFTYGEGEAKDAHTAEEAAAHTVVHITKPGTYCITGKLSLGQIAVDLGKEAKKDPQAVVTLILNGVDITCKVAPAVIFYNVYECGSDDTETATKDVTTVDAGANVIIADGTENTVNGSYVARIYDPETVVLSEDKTKVEDADKLHKYDGAFYAKQSMNISGGEEGTGVLNIHAENEGLDSEMHLSICSGNINIRSGNDGINTNEDGVSVTAIHGGNVNIRVTGETGEGDGIDSNGWLVITGGAVTAVACGTSGDSGIDSDKGIHIIGGTVLATGNMLDRLENGQTYAVFNFSKRMTGSETVTLKDETGAVIMETTPGNAYAILVFSSPQLQSGTYTLWEGDRQLAGQTGGMMGGQRPGGMGAFQPPEGNRRPEQTEDATRPAKEGQTGGRWQEGSRWWEEGKWPEDFQWPEGGKWPEDFQWPEDGKWPEDFQWPEDGKWPEGFQWPEGNSQQEGGRWPEGFQQPEGNSQQEGGRWPEGFQQPEGNSQQEGGKWPQWYPGNGFQVSLSPEFVIKDGSNNFSGITYFEET